MALFGSGLFLTMVGIAVFGPFIFPYTRSTCRRRSTSARQHDQLAYNGCPPLTAGHLLGTTGSLQLDLLTLVVNGGRISLLIGVGRIGLRGHPRHHRGRAGRLLRRLDRHHRDAMCGRPP